MKLSRTKPATLIIKDSGLPSKAWRPSFRFQAARGSSESRSQPVQLRRNQALNLKPGSERPHEAVPAACECASRNPDQKGMPSKSPSAERVARAINAAPAFCADESTRDRVDRLWTDWWQLQQKQAAGSKKAPLELPDR